MRVYRPVRTLLPLLSVLLGFLAAAGTAHAYIEIPYTLGRVVAEANNIVLMKVVKVNAEKRLIYYEKVADIKGKHPTDKINHQIQNGFHPREPKTIMDWAKEGEMALFFHNGGASETFIGEYWYQCYPGTAPWWSMTHAEPFLGWAFHGSVAKLETAVRDLLANKEVVVPCVQFDGNKVPQLKALMHERKAPLWRMKASLQLQDYNALIRDPKKYIVGLGAAGPEAIPDMLKKLASADLKDRLAAAEELAGFGSEGKPALDGLRKTLGDPEKMLQLKSAEAILRIDPSVGEAVSVLVRFLGDPDKTLRVRSLELLSEAGVAAKAAAPALGKLLGDTDAEVRAKSAEALGKIGPDGVPALLAGLRDANPEVRVLCINGLAAVPPDSPAAGTVLPKLVEQMADADLGVKVAVLTALRPYGPRAGGAVPGLLPLLKNPNRDTRLAAVNLLMEVGPAAKPAIPALTEMVLADSSGTVRRDAAETLGRLGADARDAAPRILANLTDPLIRDRDLTTFRAVFASAYGRVKGPETGPTAELLGDNADLTVAQLLEGDGQATVETADKMAGNTSLKVTATQRFSQNIPGWNFKIVENPTNPGEFRYIRFAWKKTGQSGMMIQLSAGGDWNRRYVGGANVANFQPAIQVSDRTPRQWTVVTRDLFADFKGGFTLTGIAITPMSPDFGLVDGVYLGRTIADLDKVMPAQ